MRALEKKVLSNPKKLNRTPFWAPKSFYRTLVRGTSEPQTGFIEPFASNPPCLGYPFKFSLTSCEVEMSAMIVRLRSWDNSKSWSKDDKWANKDGQSWSSKDQSWGSSNEGQLPRMMDMLGRRAETLDRSARRGWFSKGVVHLSHRKPREPLEGMSAERNCPQILNLV